MYTLRNFLRLGLLDAVGKKPIFWIVDNASGWLSKGVLEESDLAEIYAKIESLKEVTEDA